MTKLTTIGSLALGLFLSTQAHASINLDWNVDGLGSSANPINLTPSSDKLYLTGLGGNLTLQDNVSQVVNINRLFFYLGDSGSLETDISVPLNRNITLRTSTQSITQGGLLEVRMPQDTLTVNIAAGAPLSFTFAEGRVDITPLGGGPWVFGAGSIGSWTERGLDAEMVFTPVPEPTTVFAGAMLLLPIASSAIRYMRKNRTA